MAGKAKARLLYSTISASERVSGLGAKGALVYTWLLAHCDDQGRFSGTPRKVKALVLPLVDEVSVDEIDTALDAMEQADLIIRYCSGVHHDLIQVTDWWEYNQGLRVVAPSRYPPPPGWQDRVTDRDKMGRFSGSRPQRPKREKADQRPHRPMTEAERLRDIVGLTEAELEASGDNDDDVVLPDWL